MQEVELADHQRSAVARLHNGSILTGGVGTGKTRTAMRYYIEKEAPKRVVVITTAKKRDSLDWEGEAILHGVGTSAETSLSGVITVDSWNNLWKYIDVEGAFFIFDEQRLVGSGKWVKSFYKIAKHNNWILLSATPGDTWLDYIPVFVANGFYKNQTEFTREHVVYSRFSKFPKVEKFIGTGTLIKHRNSLLVDMPYQRRTTRVLKDVLVSHDENRFKKVVKDRWHVIEERPLRDVAEMYSVMRKVVNSDPSRVLAVRKLMTVHPRLIVFYNFDYELEILRGLASCSTEQKSSLHSIQPQESQQSLRSGHTTTGAGDSSTVKSFSTKTADSGTSQPLSRDLYLEQLKQKAASWPNSFGAQDTKSPQSKSSTSTMQRPSSPPCSQTMSSTPSAIGSETKPPNPSLCLWNTNRSCTCLEEKREICLGSTIPTSADGPQSESGPITPRPSDYEKNVQRILSGTPKAPTSNVQTEVSASVETPSESRVPIMTSMLPTAGGTLGLQVDGHIDARSKTMTDTSFPQPAQPAAIAEWNGHKHQEVPDTERWVYLVQYTAGAEGWNCTSTDTVVFYSLNYSYRIFEQCQGRIDRLNTPFKELTYYIFKSDSWIDKVIWKAVQLKRTFNEKAGLKDLAGLS